MATYQVNGPGGAVYRIDGPDGADPSAIVGAVTGQSAANGPAAPSGGWLRDIALGGRDVGEGVLDTLAIPHDLSVGLSNLISRGSNRFLGTHRAMLPTFSGAISDALTQAGAPVPTTPDEKLAASAIRGTAGALTGAGALGMLGIGGSALTAPANVLRAGAAGLTGGTGAGIAQRVGAGPVGQFVAGLAGGFTPAALEGGISALGGVVRPFTNAGQGQIAANLLRRQVSNPTQAAANLENAAPLVPGSMRTAGEASGDPGLLALEKGIRGRNAGKFAERVSQQNAARQAELARLGGTPDSIVVAEALRDAETAPMRDAAFAAARQARANPPAPAAPEPVVLGKRNYAASDPTEDSILQFLAKHSRGIDSGEAAEQGLDPADFRLPEANVGIKRAFRRNGMSFDEAAEALHQAGYPVADEAGNYSPNVLLDAIDSELRGHPVYSLSNTRRFAELEQGMREPPNLDEFLASDAAQGAQAPTITTPVHETIDNILASPAGARESIAKTMNWAKGLVGDRTDPETLYEVRKDLALAQRGKLQPTGQDAPNASTLAQARGQLSRVIRSLDNAIETQAPGYKAYLNRYRELSEPIDQMQTIQALQQKASSGLDTATGEPFLSAPQFSRNLQGVLDRTGSNAPRLSPVQRARLQAIREDLQRGNALSSPTVKAPGSDTFQNLMTGRRLGPLSNFVGHVPLVGKALRGVGDYVDQRVNDQLANAMLDPRYAASLLQRGISFQPLGPRLTALMGRGALPATLGPIAALPPPQTALQPGLMALPGLMSPHVQARQRSHARGLLAMIPGG